MTNLASIIFLVETSMIQMVTTLIRKVKMSMEDPMTAEDFIILGRKISMNLKMLTMAMMMMILSSSLREVMMMMMTMMIITTKSCTKNSKAK